MPNFEWIMQWIIQILPLLFFAISFLFVYKVVSRIIHYYRIKNKAGETTIDQLWNKVIELEHRSEWIWKHWKWLVMCGFLLIFSRYCILLLFSFWDLISEFFTLQANILPNRLNMILWSLALFLYILTLIAAFLFLYSDKKKQYRIYAWRVLLFGFVIFIFAFLVNFL